MTSWWLFCYIFIRKKVFELSFQFSCYTYIGLQIKTVLANRYFLVARPNSALLVVGLTYFEVVWQPFARWAFAYKTLSHREDQSNWKDSEFFVEILMIICMTSLISSNRIYTYMIFHRYKYRLITLPMCFRDEYTSYLNKQLMKKAPNGFTKLKRNSKHYINSTSIILR